MKTITNKEALNELLYYASENSGPWRFTFMSECAKQIEKDLDKLDQLKEIEKELGIDLITLYKAFRYGIYVKTKKHNDYVSPYDLRGTLGLAHIKDFANNEDYLKPNEVKLIFGKTGICLSSRNYGKTWALDKNELINEELEK